ncbi:hypothetical protein K443DRAFT_15130 [Laccaria amethystina LaAM-08-1]|uniref:Uncharacterized protein n=1 Tax=Laccaria amethystina LaAM-08-1 TaxID=1095629 RepID=A0A0C9WYZ3_9AGAR|nr:hypothetical protein K443DRAFT_15130 [Laccaria amethystina LaAM-08-1]
MFHSVYHPYKPTFSVWGFHEQDVFTTRKLAIATWSPPSYKSLLDHTQSFFPDTVPDMNRSNREHYPTTGTVHPRTD